ncbi:MAG TPA: hypothetical protein VGF91_28990 [Solirubrobacteraceae bacterium]
MSTDSATDAFGAFATAALANAKLAAQGQPDPKVSEAFGLGWQMAEIYRPDAPEQSPPVQAGDLPDLSQLNSTDWDEIGLYQLQAGITKLSELIETAGLDAPDAEDFAKVLRSTAPADRAGVLRKFHVGLMARLTAADFRLGKAYGLGRALADATRDPSNFHVELQSSRVAVLVAWIRDLATAFPPHASHAVASSLERWSEWAANPPQSGDGSEANVLPRLQGQGRLWRGLLSGEKRATDVLEQSDYIGAGERMLKNAGSLARRFLRHYWWACLVVLLLLVAGIVVMFVVDNAAGVVSGAAAILAGLGFGWKTIGTSLGAAAARAESPLWGAALDEVIYMRITPDPLLPTSAQQ